MDVEIVKATVSDLGALQILSRQTFFEAFASGNTNENMQQYLNTEFSQEKLLGELSNPDSEFYLVRIRSKSVGYLKVNFGNAQTELKENTGLEIERIYVLIEFYGKGIGQLLLNKALEIAKGKNINYAWLGVWEKNTRAIRFYEKNGFIKFGTHFFKLGADEQTDIMMSKDLK